MVGAGGCDRGPNADRPAASLEMVYFCPIQNHTQTINNIDFMGKILVIGAGGVSTVAVKKMAMNADVFTDIMLASRTKSKCDRIAEDIKNVRVRTAQVDADDCVPRAVA